MAKDINRKSHNDDQGARTTTTIRTLKSLACKLNVSFVVSLDIDGPQKGSRDWQLSLGDTGYFSV